MVLSASFVPRVCKWPELVEHFALGVMWAVGALLEPAGDTENKPSSENMTCSFTNKAQQALSPVNSAGFTLSLDRVGLEFSYGPGNVPETSRAAQCNNHISLHLQGKPSLPLIQVSNFGKLYLVLLEKL